MVNRRERLLDELLVLETQNGSSEAFRVLVERWQRRLWHHALRLTGREDVAWDVVQETWLAVSKGLAQLADPAAFPRWVYTVVTRRAADWVRANGNAPVESGDVEIAVEESAPSEAVAQVRRALSALPADQRALLSLFYLEGFDVRDVAEIHGVPEGTVKSRLFHARRAMRAQLERGNS